MRFLFLSLYAVAFFAVPADARAQMWEDIPKSDEESQPQPEAPPPPAAQPKDPRITGEDRTYAMNPHYVKMAYSLAQGIEDGKLPPGFDFGTLRLLYASSSYYDPLGEETEGKLLDLAFAVQGAEDPASQENYLEQYRLLFTQHIGNIGTVANALALSRDDPRFGKAELLREIMSGLFQSVFNSGPGTNILNAYDTLTAAEETMLLNHLGVKVLQIIPAQEGVVYYNMYDVEDLDSGRKYTIFVDVSKPMEFLEKTKPEETLDIRKQ